MSIDDLSTWDVLVGRVSGRWDKAALKIKPFSPVPERFAAGSRLCAVVDGRRSLLSIRSSRPSGHSVIADCGFSTAEEAERFEGAELFIHPSMRPVLAEDEFYLDQLFGMKVVTESGEDLGKIEEILETKAHNVYVTPHAMIPGHADYIVKTDLENRLLVVRDMPGLRTDALDGEVH